MFLVTVVDDVYDFLHFCAYLLHLVLGVGVEEYLAQQSVIFGEYALRYLHVALEGGAWCVLMFHDGSKGEGGDEWDGEGVGYGLVVFFEGVFADVEFESVV